MAIPKIIYYCWFGGDNIPEKEQKCIKSWEKFAPDFEIRRIDESNFHIAQCDFAKEAYGQGAFAFVSDYARVKTLYEKGGIYLDADVMMIEPFLIDDKEGFLGFERRAFVGTALIGAEAGNKVIEEMLQYYESHHYMGKDGRIDNIANVSLLTETLIKYGLKRDGRKQRIAGFTIYNREVFYPKKINDCKFEITKDTIAIHTCSNSWMSEREKRRGNNKIWINVARPILQKIKIFGTKIFGKEKIRQFEIKLRNKLR